MCRIRFLNFIPACYNTYQSVSTVFTDFPVNRSFRCSLIKIKVFREIHKGQVDPHFSLPCSGVGAHSLSGHSSSHGFPRGAWEPGLNACPPDNRFNSPCLPFAPGIWPDFQWLFHREKKSSFSAFHPHSAPALPPVWL